VCLQESRHPRDWLTERCGHRSCPQPSGLEHGWLLRLQLLALQHLLQLCIFTRASSHLPPLRHHQQAPLPLSAFCVPPVGCQVSSLKPCAPPRPCTNPWASFHLLLQLPLPGVFCPSPSLFTLAAPPSLLPWKFPIANSPRPFRAPGSFFLLLATVALGMCPQMAPVPARGTALASLQSNPLRYSYLRIHPSTATRRAPHHEHITDHHCTPRQTTYRINK